MAAEREAVAEIAEAAEAPAPLSDEEVSEQLTSVVKAHYPAEDAEDVLPAEWEDLVALHTKYYAQVARCWELVSAALKEEYAEDAHDTDAFVVKVGDFIASAVPEAATDSADSTDTPTDESLVVAREDSNTDAVADEDADKDAEEDANKDDAEDDAALNTSRASIVSRVSVSDLGEEGLQDRVRSMEAAMDKISEEREEDQSAAALQVGELQIQISALEKSLEQKQTELGKAREELKQMQDEKLAGLSGDAKEEMQTLMTKIGELQAAASAKADEIAKQEAEREQLALSQAALQKSLDELKASSTEARTAAENKIVKLRADLKAAKKNAGGKGGKVDPKEAKQTQLKIQGLNNKNEKLASQVEKLQSEVEAQKQKLSSRPAVSGADKMKMEKEKKATQKKLDLFTKTHQDDLKQIEAKTKRVDELEAEVKTMSKELETLSKTAGSAKELAEKAAAMEEEVATMTKDFKKLTKEKAALEVEYVEERKMRRKYYNTIEEMKGNVRVYCRARPISKSEIERGNTDCIHSPDEYSITVSRGKGFDDSEFLFDRVYMPSNSQDEVYEDTGNLINSALDGFNVCIFAYGQTGSGKTYTMIGDNNRPMQSPGIAPRAFKDIYEKIGELGPSYEVNVEVYMVELYCGELLDLLAPKRNSTNHDAKKNLKIRKDQKGMIFIENLTYRKSASGDELYQLFEEGSKSRHVASTKMNAESSRSHLVVGIVIECKSLLDGKVTKGKLSLVDLAGSERLGKTGATGQVAKEGASINKSLSALAEVINALSTNNPHVPFRNSILTQLMQVRHTNLFTCYTKLTCVGARASTRMCSCYHVFEHPSPTGTSTVYFSRKLTIYSRSLPGMRSGFFGGQCQDFDVCKHFAGRLQRPRNSQCAQVCTACKVDPKQGGQEPGQRGSGQTQGHYQETESR